MLELKPLSRSDANRFQLIQPMDNIVFRGTLIFTLPNEGSRVRNSIQRMLNTGYLKTVTGRAAYWGRVIAAGYGIPLLNYSAQSTYDRSFTLLGMRKGKAHPEFDSYMRLLGFSPSSPSWDHTRVDYAPRDEVIRGDDWRKKIEQAKDHVEKLINEVTKLHQDYHLRPIGWEPGADIPKEMQIYMGP